ncbi:MAG: bacillithiol biosynthesis cysteine-adding enzyme BshC [Flavobacteriales bacterium]|nr:bacillithiol biosynthesis cysteine-adding enzyme BshC [Flavobacteriales bacterium]
MNLIKSNKVDFYPRIISDYLSGELKAKKIVNWDYSEKQLLDNKGRSYSSSNRAIVYKALKNQYSPFELTEKEKFNLALFSKETTFTITTGHQLMLLGGPLFFYTKIMDVIKLSKQISTSQNAVLPIFWMASEDHDYQEISKVNLFGKTISCPGNNAGPVGRIQSKHFKSFIKEVNQVLGDDKEFSHVKELINQAFDSGKNLSHITRVFIRELFKEEGLLIFDADSRELKTLFKDVARKEFFEQIVTNSSKDHLNKIKQDYKLQVKPREINLFYIENGIRKRFVRTKEGFSTSDQSMFWTPDEIEELIDKTPEKISPNVLLRPVYQEILFPNLAYVGGAGEVSYWLELKPVFNALKIGFPIPILRNSYFVLTEKNFDWLSSRNLFSEALFDDVNVQINALTKFLSSNPISLDQDFEFLKKFFHNLKIKGDEIDVQLKKVIEGEEKRANSALKNVEKRFLKAEKKKHQEDILKLVNIINKLFPGSKPMERVVSFIPFLAKDLNRFKHQIETSPNVLEKKIVFFNSL